MRHDIPTFKGTFIEEPTTITGTTTNPTKGTTTIDKAVLSDHGNGLCSFTMNYYHNVAGTGGSGDYLFTLPGGYQFDLFYHLQNLTLGDPLMSGVEAWIPGASGLLAAGGNLRQNAYAIVYDATRFRILQGAEGLFNSNPSIRNPISSTLYGFGTNDLGIQMAFTFKKA